MNLSTTTILRYVKQGIMENIHWRGVSLEKFQKILWNIWQEPLKFLWKYNKLMEIQMKHQEKIWLVFWTMLYQVPLLRIENRTSCWIDCYKKILSISSKKWNSRWKINESNWWPMEIFIYGSILRRRILSNLDFRIEIMKKYGYSWWAA